MNLQQRTRSLLKEIGNGHMMSTAYDAAWVARLEEHAGTVGSDALDWLRANQLPDGSWGAAQPIYCHDRLICTLAAMVALAKGGHAEDRIRLQQAGSALEWLQNGLHQDSAGETVGFEMVVPTLMAEARTLGLINGRPNAVLDRLSHYRQAKLTALPEGTINRFVTLAFSAEMAGPDGLQLLDIENLQEKNGSIAHSPSATAFFVEHVEPENELAMAYLRSVSSGKGIPNVAPFDVFERAWTMWNLSLFNTLDEEGLALCQPHIKFLKEAWNPGRGVGFAAGYTPKDSDDTGLVFEVLGRMGHPVDIEAVLHYEQDGHFRCFSLEANPSISANIHVLGALRQAGQNRAHSAVQKVIGFLRRVQTLQAFWFDKWHASPYYPTAHAVIACLDCADDLIDDALYWILATQNEDGSWGYYMPTAEETAYCLQALFASRRSGFAIPKKVLQRGVDWLEDHAEPPYPPLWIGKCLYCPEYVVSSAVLGALLHAEQE